HGHIIADLLDAELSVAAAVINLAGKLVGAAANSVAKVLVDVCLTNSQLVQLVQNGGIGKTCAQFGGSSSLAASAAPAAKTAAEQRKQQNPGGPRATAKAIHAIIVTSHGREVAQ